MTGDRPWIIDTFCCEGGATRGYQRAGFRVLGVDIVPRPAYPGDAFVQANAIEVLNDRNFMSQFVAAVNSPPCQNTSTLTKGNRRRPGWKDNHVDFIAPTRTALNRLGIPYVIENVPSTALRADVVLCGLTFGLKVFRHRYFEISGFAVPQPPHTPHKGHRVAGWRHGVRYEGDMVAVYGDGGGKGSLADWQNAMGIDWITDKATLAEAIPPAYAEHIGTHLRAHLGLTVQLDLLEAIGASA